MSYILMFMLVNRIICITAASLIFLFDYLRGDSQSPKEIFYILIAYFLFADLVIIDCISYTFSTIFSGIDKYLTKLLKIISDKIYDFME